MAVVYYALVVASAFSLAHEITKNVSRVNVYEICCIEDYAIVVWLYCVAGEQLTDIGRLGSENKPLHVVQQSSKCMYCKESVVC